MKMFFRAEDDDREYPLFNGWDYEEITTNEVWEEFGDYFESSDFDECIDYEFSGVDFESFGGNYYSFSELLYKLEEDTYYESYDSWKWDECQKILDNELWELSRNGGVVNICGDDIVYVEVDEENLEGEEENLNEAVSNAEENVETQVPIFENLFNTLLS